MLVLNVICVTLISISSRDRRNKSCYFLRERYFYQVTFTCARFSQPVHTRTLTSGEKGTFVEFLLNVSLISPLLRKCNSVTIRRL